MWSFRTRSPSDERCRSFARDDGSSLVLVLLVVPVAAALAGLLVLATTAETLTAFRHRQSFVVRYAASALAEQVVADLRRQADWTPVLSGLVTSTFSGPETSWQLDDATRVDLGARQAAIQAATDTDEPRGADTPRWRPYAWGTLARLAAPSAPPGESAVVGAWVADDGEDGDGDAAADSNGIVAVHVEAFGRGRARWALTLLLARGRGGPEDLWRLSRRDDR
jgi:hypothetical protein